MDRRTYLGAVGTAMGLAGCSALDVGDGGEASAVDRYGDPHADHDWPVEPDPETAPAFDGEWPPGVDDGGMSDPKVFLRFHDVVVSRRPYVSAALDDKRAARGPDGSTDVGIVTERVAADVEAERYLVESTRGTTRYGEDGVHYFRDADGVVHPSADRGHVVRRAVGGSTPHVHVTFRWTDAVRNPDGSFVLSSEGPAGDGVPEVFGEPWRGVPQSGTLRLDPEGRIAGWRLRTRQTFHRDGGQHTVVYTSESAVTYADDPPSGLPETTPAWTDG